jgi:glyoxylase-like metal-dependent hydrolase (beta-lactamase superfamily II)
MTDTLRQVAENVWIFPRDEDPNRVQPNVGIIVAGKNTVLVDSGNSPRHARHIMVALDDIQAPSVSYVIYTHSHWDHVFGGMVFGAPVIGHELCHKHMAEMASKPWGHAHVQEEIIRTPGSEGSMRAMARAIEDWRNFRLVQPELILSDTLRLHLQDLTIEVAHVGGQHAPDSVVVQIPEVGVMFTGDCYYPPPLSSRKATDTPDYAMMQMLYDRGYTVYVDGHGEPLNRDAFRQLITPHEKS